MSDINEDSTCVDSDKDVLVRGKRHVVSVTGQHFLECPLKNTLLGDDDRYYTVFVRA